VIRVTFCAVMTSREENASQIRTLGDDETYIAGASGGTVGAST